MKGKIKMTDFALTPIEQCGQRVLTTAQLAEAYRTTEKRITENFNRNKDRYTEGKHFYCLTGDELKEFLHSANCGLQNSSKIRTLYLWTERGTLLHAKSLNTDKAWEAYDYLIEHYFRSREMLTYYNDALVKILENQEEMKKRQNDFEEYIRREISYIRNDILAVRHDANIINDNTEKNIQTAVEAATSETVKVLAPFMNTSGSISAKNKIRRQPRNYSKGKIENLPPAIKSQVDGMIISGKYSCQKISDFITGITGESISYMTVSRYIKKYFKD